jgi:hypothetical protein
MVRFCTDDGTGIQVGLGTVWPGAVGTMMDAGQPLSLVAFLPAPPSAMADLLGAKVSF